MMMGIPKQGPVVAIDGPAGTGKSSTTRRLADLLGFTHIDTGALYRAIAFLISEQEETDTVEARAAELARTVHLEFKRNPKKNPANRVLANGRDVTDFIRTPQISMMASQVSAVPEVRAALLGLQRRLGCQGRTILEGRDIGTVIFPDADVKFFLTASVEERAKRRLAELEAAGSDVPSFEEVKKQIVARDQGDSTRAIAPLKKAADAIEVDTSLMTLDQVVQHMESVVRSKVALPGTSTEDAKERS
jgi:cytidylate kinase